MPYGDPAGYLPRVKRSRKRAGKKGGLQTVPVGRADGKRSFQPVKPGARPLPVKTSPGFGTKKNVTGGHAYQAPAKRRRRRIA